MGKYDIHWLGNMSLYWFHGLWHRVSDLELGEDEVVKLASLGNESNTRETIDILRKSLVIRNKLVFSVFNLTLLKNIWFIYSGLSVGSPLSFLNMLS